MQKNIVLLTLYLKNHALVSLAKKESITWPGAAANHGPLTKGAKYANSAKKHFK